MLWFQEDEAKLKVRHTQHADNCVRKCLLLL